ncbi:MAG TPA: PilN domain-containing protein [Frankiaceae bacterium]|nr:PilN domain-containing protein [Frankiaceae bacterium]
MAAQTFGSTSTTLAAPPRVNLLPPEIAERAKVRKAQLAMVGTGLAAVAVVGVMYTQASAKVSDANEQKEQAVAANVALRGDLAKLETVKATYAKVDAANKTLTTAMKYEVRWSSFFHGLTLTIPENVWLDQMEVRMTVAKTAGSGDNAPVLDPQLGTVTFKGKAFSHDDVSSWLESLDKQKGYSDPFFTLSKLVIEPGMGNRPRYTFDSTAYVNEKALSNRYEKGLPR